MPNLSSVTCIILCGGQGKRLRKSVSDRPKALAEIDGKPFIYILLDQLIQAGAEKVVLCTGYMATQMKNVVGDRYGNLEVVHSEEERPLGTGGALYKAIQYIETSTALVMNGDSYVECDLSRFLSWHLRTGAKISLLVKEVSDVRRYGSVQLDTECRVTKFVEKEDGLVSEVGLINAGLYLIARELIQTIPRAKKYSLEKEFFPSIINENIFGYRTAASFIDIGTPESYSRAAQIFSQYFDNT